MEKGGEGSGDLRLGINNIIGLFIVIDFFIVIWPYSTTRLVFETGIIVAIEARPRTSYVLPDFVMELNNIIGSVSRWWPWWDAGR